MAFVRSVFCATSLLLATTVGAQQLRRVNQAVDGFNQLEPDVAINPVNRQQIVVAYIEDRGQSCPGPSCDIRIGVSISNDGGNGWSDATDLPNPYQVNVDPSVGFDSFGNIVVGYLSYDSSATQFNGTTFPGTSAILVARSSDGGNTWQAAVVAQQVFCAGGPAIAFEDKPWIAVDSSPTSAYRDTVHVVWQREPPTGTSESDIYYSRGSFTGPAAGTCVCTCPGGTVTCASIGSVAPCAAPAGTIGSATFSTPMQISDTIAGPNNDYHNGPVVAVGVPGGEVFVSWLLADVTQMPLAGARLLFDRDQNGGSGAVPFGTDITAVASFTTPPRTLNPGSSPPPGQPVGFRMRPFPALAADPSTPTFGSQTVYVAYAADPDGINMGDESDVCLVFSTDSGTTWAAQGVAGGGTCPGGGVALNKQPDPTTGGPVDLGTNAQFHPRVAVSVGGFVNPFIVNPGTVMLAWYDRRMDPMDLAYEVFTATLRALPPLRTITPDGGVSTSYFALDPNPLFQTTPVGHPTAKTLGEYLGLAVDVVDFVLAWPDTRTSGLADLDIVANRMLSWDLAVIGGGPCPAVPMTTPKLVLRRLDTPSGDDVLTFKGEVMLPSPVLPPLDPRANGAQVILEGAAGALASVTVPPGGFIPPGFGWRVNAAGTRWTYLNKLGTGAGSVIKAVVHDRSASAPGLVRFLVRARNGAFPAVPADLPITGRMVFDPLAGNTQCGEATFIGPPPQPSCVFNASGSTLRCG